MTDSAKTALRTLIPVIGDPVAQVATPGLWNTHFEQTGQNALAIALQIAPAGLPAFVDWVRHTSNVPGFVSTIPHKPALPPLCDRQSDAVRFLGVANAVRQDVDGFLECDMFDGVGMLQAIAACGVPIAGARMLIVGAGAAGSAVAYQAAVEGAGRVALRDRDSTKAESLAARIEALSGRRTSCGFERSGEEYDIVVNASPLGMRADDPLPVDPGRFGPTAVIADAVTGTAPTALMSAARSAGLQTVDGAAMAAGQAAQLRAYLGLL
ncbi:MAG: shikimate dehydrogenase [Pseudomonadota bacterium]